MGFNKLYEKQCLPFIALIKKHLRKQVAIITNTLEKKSFAVATFKGLMVVVSF